MPPKAAPVPERTEWEKHEPPSVCWDCQTPESKPVEIRRAKGCITYRCPKCGLQHVSGTPESVKSAKKAKS